MDKLIKEYNIWCKKNGIPTGQKAETKHIMIADWWIKSSERYFNKKIIRLRDKISKYKSDERLLNNWLDDNTFELINSEWYVKVENVKNFINS